LTGEVVILGVEQHALVTAGIVDNAGAEFGPVFATDDECAD
jgi:hypothetical protein